MKKYRFSEFLLIAAEIVLTFLIISRGGAYFLDRLEDMRSYTFTSVFMIDDIIKALLIFKDKLTGDANIFFKLILFAKTVILLALVARLVYVLFIHNTRENTLVFFLLQIGKLLLIYLFLFTGIAVIMRNMADDKIFDFGKLFELIPTKTFSQTKNMLIIIVFGITIYDFFKFHNSN